MCEICIISVAIACSRRYPDHQGLSNKNDTHWYDDRWREGSKCLLSPKINLRFKSRSYLLEIRSQWES